MGIVKAGERWKERRQEKINEMDERNTKERGAAGVAFMLKTDRISIIS